MSSPTASASYVEPTTQNAMPHFEEERAFSPSSGPPSKATSLVCWTGNRLVRSRSAGEIEPCRPTSNGLDPGGRVCWVCAPSL